MMTMTVSASTVSCVSATSGAPSSIICRLMPTPTVPRSTAAVSRELVTAKPTTETAMISSGIRSHGLSSPGVRGAGVMPSTPGVNQVATPRTMTLSTSGSRWREGLRVLAIAPSARPRSVAPWTRAESSSLPEAGASFRPSSSGQIRLRATTPSVPTTSTATEMSSGTLTPCHSARCDSCVAPTEATTASTGASKSGSRKARGRESTPGRAAGSQSRTGASFTPDMSRGPSKNAPKTIFAE